MNGVDKLVQKKLMEAARAVGFLEGMSTWLWTKVGPDLAEEAVVEFERRVSAIAECFRTGRGGQLMCQVMGVDMTEDEITLTRDAGCPEHYRGDGYITCSRAMKSALAMWPAAMALCSTMSIWWWCCAFKYVWRCMAKGKTLEDIDKAIDCLYKLRKEIKPCLKSQAEADHIVAGKNVEE